MDGVNGTGVNPNMNVSLTMYRNDWYNYTYNYYDGAFYSYYEDKFMTKVNASMDMLSELVNATVPFTIGGEFNEVRNTGTNGSGVPTEIAVNFTGVNTTGWNDTDWASYSESYLADYSYSYSYSYEPSTYNPSGYDTYYYYGANGYTPTNLGPTTVTNYDDFYTLAPAEPTINYYYDPYDMGPGNTYDTYYYVGYDNDRDPNYDDYGAIINVGYTYTGPYEAGYYAKANESNNDGFYRNGYDFPSSYTTYGFTVGDDFTFKQTESRDGKKYSMFLQFKEYFNYAISLAENVEENMQGSCNESCGSEGWENMCCAQVSFYENN